MSRAFAQLRCADLRALAAEAREGRLSRPYSSMALGRRLGPLRAEATASEMEALGLDPGSLALAFGLDGSQDQEREIVGDFMEHFRRKHWPGAKVPDIYYDPRSLGRDSATRAVLHAKCIVVDDRNAFVTSANLTTAAQERNIEAGLLVEDAGLAQSLRLQFETLVSAGILKPAFRAAGRAL